MFVNVDACSVWVFSTCSKVFDQLKKKKLDSNISFFLVLSQRHTNSSTWECNSKRKVKSSGAPDRNGANRCAARNTMNSNERISPFYFLQHLHSAARESKTGTNWKQECAKEEAVDNYTPARKTKISNLQGAAEQAGQEIARGGEVWEGL